MSTKIITDPRGRTPVDPALFHQPGSLIMPTSGQSMLSNWGKFPRYVPWTGGVYEFSLLDGKIYPCDGEAIINADQFSDAEGGRLSVLPYWGDMLCAQKKCARVLIACLNIGGTSSYDWCPVGTMYSRASLCVARLLEVGLAPNYWVHMLGQQDCLLRTTSRQFADYTKWMIASLRAQGMGATMAIGRGCYWQGVSDEDPVAAAEVVRGQELVCAETAGTLLGPNDDEWGVEHRVDGVHPAESMRYHQCQRWWPTFPTL